MNNTLQDLQQVLGTTVSRQASIEALREFHSRTAYCEDAQGNLIGLVLSGTDLETLHIPKAWNTLQYLNLSDNKKLHSLIFESSMPFLVHLDGSDSGLEVLKLPAGCDNLQWLDLSRNQLQGAIAFMGDLPAVQYLDISENQLTQLKLPDCAVLKYLYAAKNKINRFVVSSNSKQLEVLHLKENQLEELPANLLDLTGLHTLYLYGNPLSHIPKDIIEGGEGFNAAEAIKSYLQSFQKSRRVYLHQAKMVLVGNGEVGKSSIKVKLLDKNAPLPKKEDRTPGLDIATYTLKDLPPQLTQLETPINFDLNIWDFGGQGKYREVQQLFCSRKSLYLFVTAHDDQPSKEDYVGFEYWLSMVNAYSFDDSDQKASPVIHVVNKIDEKTHPINQATRQKQFNNVEQFVSISCKTLQNFAMLEEVIRQVLPKVNSAIFSDQFSAYWMNVKASLEARRTENHISYTTYLEICAENDLSVAEAENWIRTLDRIGTVIYFGNHPILKDDVILNPLWVKDGFYKVLDSKLVRNGNLPEEFLEDIWADLEAEERAKLLEMMKTYELCYEQYDFAGRRVFIIPAMLNEKALPLPAHLKTPDVSIKFKFSPFLPAGTVNKLTVRLHPLIYNETKWKNHVLLHESENNSFGHVWEDWEAKVIHLDLYGQNLASLYHQIESTLSSQKDKLVNTRYLNQLDFKVEAFYKDKWHDKEVLQHLKGEPFPFLWQAAHGEKGFDPSSPTKHPIPMSKPKVFVSYAHKVDSRYFKLFVEGIKAHSNWDIFDDRHILIGEDWHERLQTEVQRCDFAIFLLSPYFVKSDYIQQHEFGQFVQRNASTGFPFFSVLLTDCNYSDWETISKRQLFPAKGEDYDLAKSHRDQQISFDLLARFDKDGEIIPNPYLNTFYKNFVEAVNKAVKGKS